MGSRAFGVANRIKNRNKNLPQHQLSSSHHCFCNRRTFSTFGILYLKKGCKICLPGFQDSFQLRQCAGLEMHWMRASNPGVGNLWLSSQMWFFLMAAFVKKYVKNMALSAKKVPDPWSNLWWIWRLIWTSCYDIVSENYYIVGGFDFKWSPFASPHEVPVGWCTLMKKFA